MLIFFFLTKFKVTFFLPPERLSIRFLQRSLIKLIICDKKLLFCGHKLEFCANTIVFCEDKLAFCSNKFFFVWAQMSILQ